MGEPRESGTVFVFTFSRGAESRFINYLRRALTLVGEPREGIRQFVRITYMARFARQTFANSVYHVISRFVNREYRLDSDALRQEYLRRVAQIQPRSSWDVLGYALMSSHIHWLLVCRGAPISRFIQPLHCGFAVWLNRTQRRIGHVFAERPSTIVVTPQDTLRVLAYIHNNPVRAGVVARASESSWTSHNAYYQIRDTPSWLSVRLGLALSGFKMSAKGRSAFNDHVTQQGEYPRDPILSGNTSAEARSQIREALGSPIELESPVLAGDKNEHQVLIRAGAKQPMPFISPLDVADYVAGMLGLESNLLFSRSRARHLVKARRLILMICCQHYGQSVGSIAGFLGISASAASDLLHRRSEQTRALREPAQQIAQALVCPKT